MVALLCSELSSAYFIPPPCVVSHKSFSPADPSLARARKPLERSIDLYRRCPLLLRKVCWPRLGLFSCVCLLRNTISVASRCRTAGPERSDQQQQQCRQDGSSYYSMAECQVVPSDLITNSDKREILQIPKHLKGSECGVKVKIRVAGCHANRQTPTLNRLVG